MKRIKWVLVGILLSFGISMSVCAADTESNSYEKIYDSYDGLESIEINTIVQTEDGYIWAGTYSGLYQFDGMRFSSAFRDKGIKNVLSLYSDSKGRLWIGTNDAGAACYDLHTKELTFYSTEEGLGANSVRQIAEDTQGNIFVGTVNSLNRIDENGTVESICIDGNPVSVLSMCSLPDGGMIGISGQGEVVLYRDETLQYCKNLLPNGVWANIIAPAPNGCYLIGTSENEIYKLDLQKDVPEATLWNTTGTVSGLMKILYDAEKDAYYICGDTGLGMIGADRTFTDISASGFELFLTDMLKDYQGNLWIASNKQGVMKVSANPFENLLAKNQLPEHIVNAVLEYRGALYVGCGDGLLVLNKQTRKAMDSPLTELFAGARIRNIYKDSKENLWISTYSPLGLVKIDQNGEISFFNEEEGNASSSRFRFTRELQDGTILAATGNSVEFIRDDRIVSSIDIASGEIDSQLLDCEETEDGSVLCGSDGNGIYVIKDGEVIRQIGPADGLDALVVLNIVPCRGGYLYVTSSALFYDDLTEIRKLNNFPYSNNYDIQIDKNHQAWVTGSAGIFVVSEDTLLSDAEDMAYIKLNNASGLNTTLTANSYNYLDADGRLYLCGSTDVSSISTTEFDNHTADGNIKVWVHSIEADGERIEPDAQGNYVIPKTINRVTISPAVLNYTLASPSIQVSLEGFDDNGVVYAQNEQQRVDFTNLSPGKYRLSIRVYDEKREVLLNEAEAVIVKKAMLTQMKAFWIAVVLLLLALTAVIMWLSIRSYNYRIIKKRYFEVEREKWIAERANEEKSVFQAKMSHEIRTPLNAILGMNEAILNEADSDVIKEYAVDIENAGQTLLALLSDIIDVTALDAEKARLEPCEYDLREFVREIDRNLQISGESQGLSVRTFIDERIPSRLIGDVRRLKQVMLNLSSNAVKYTKKGTIELRVDLLEELEEKVKLRISFKDTGIGIAKEDQLRIFEAYERGNNEQVSATSGAGLGLDISRKLLSLMGSEIELESEPGKGSEFFFVLEQEKATPGQNRSSAEEQTDYSDDETPVFAENSRILVVDDTPLCIKVVEKLLGDTGLIIDKVFSGEECLLAADTRRYDLILMDNMMPRMDGTETLHRLRSGYNLCEKTPVVVLTANALPGSKQQYLDAGFDDYMSKPVSKNDLMRIVKKYIPRG